MKKIAILGTGCAKCTQLGDNAEAAAKSLGIEYEIEKVKKIEDIMKYSVMITPAIAIDGVVKSCGKVLSVEQISEMLR